MDCKHRAAGQRNVFVSPVCANNTTESAFFFLSVVLALLELTLQTRLSSNSEIYLFCFLTAQRNLRILNSIFLMFLQVWVKILLPFLCP